jgi:hypothetical protein
MHTLLCFCAFHAGIIVKRHSGITTRLAPKNVPPTLIGGTLLVMSSRGIAHG